MSLPALPATPDQRSIAERVNVMIRDYNSGRVDDLAQALTDIATLQADTRTLQVVSTQTGAVATGTTTIPFDDTIPQSGEGDQYMSLAITPKSATSRLIIEVTGFFTNSAAAASAITMALFQDSAADALAAGFVISQSTTLGGLVKFTHAMTSGTTSSTTFKVRAGDNAAGTTTFNGQGGGRKYGGVIASSIVIREELP